MSDPRDQTGRIGASRVAAVLGLDPWKTPLEAWLTITGAEPAEASAQNEAQELGHELEPILARWVGRRLGAELESAQSEFADPELPWLVVHPDYQVRGRPAELAELKTTGIATRGLADQWGEDGTEDVPASVEIQVTAQLGVSMRKFAHVGAMIGGRGRALFGIELNEERAARWTIWRARLAAWWYLHVVLGVPPAPTTPSEAQIVYQRARPESFLTVDDDLLADLSRFATVKRDMGSLKAELDALQLRIQNRMRDHVAAGDATGALVNWPSAMHVDRRRIAIDLARTRTKRARALRTFMRLEVDLKRLEREHPALYRSYKTLVGRSGLRLTARGCDLVNNEPMAVENIRGSNGSSEEAAGEGGV